MTSAIKLLALAIIGLATTVSPAADPLPSWNVGEAKSAIFRFVARVTDRRSPEYVEPAERIAVFDNDGTLWSEKPVYFQLRFAIDRIGILAPDRPAWRDDPLMQAAISGDTPALLASGKEGLLRLVMESHAGMTTDEFAAISKDWLESARHPRFDRRYIDLTYRPMLELLEYLRGSGFKTWIVSGGGIEFLRVFSQEAYGVPPEQVVGSSIKTAYEVRDGRPTLSRLPEIDFIDDKAGKPVGIHKFIGRRPIAAFGNSDGDLQMLEWVTTRNGPSLGVIVRHTDAEREWAYDRESHVGRLDTALDRAPEQGWVVVDMKRDWLEVFAETASRR